MNAGSGSPLSPECARCRRWLTLAGPGPRALAPDTGADARHLQACVACRTYAEEALAWRRLGGRLREAVTAPTEVRHRLFRELALARTGGLHEPTLRRRKAWAAGALAVLVMLLGAVGLWWSQQSSTTEGTTTAAVVDDHWRDVHRQHVDSNDPITVQRWLSQRLAIPVRVETLPGAVLEGARLCFLHGKLGAVLHYRVGTATVSYYVMPADQRAGQVERDRAAIRQESEQGYNVLLWQDRGLLHALVSALPRTRLRVLAAACRAHDAPRAADVTRTG